MTGLIAIIPARGGSKGLPRKNVLPLSGKPLIAHSILAAREAPSVSRVVVTTDNEEIARVSRAFGAEVVDRPAALATDDATSAAAVRHCLETLRAGGERADHLVLLQPTSPLRRADHIESCWQAFTARGDVRSAISVMIEPHSPYKSFRVEDGLLEPLMGREKLEAPRQSLPPIYRSNGAIYILRIDTFLKEGSFYVPPCMAFVMEETASIDIDTQNDLLIAEQILQREGSS